MPAHAVVIGGGIAGLLAGRVLTDHLERVTLIERDRFPEAAVPRSGLPQSRHLHILLTRGRMALEQLLPGIGDELLAAGAEAIDAAGDIAWLTPGGWARTFSRSPAAALCWITSSAAACRPWKNWLFSKAPE